MYQKIYLFTEVTNLNTLEDDINIRIKNEKKYMMN